MLVLTALVVPIAKLPILLLPINLVWLELIVHPVSALAFERAEPVADGMIEPLREPKASLIELSSALRSAACGSLLAIGSILVYWLRLPTGENEARAAAMAVMIMGGLMMVWAEYAGSRAWQDVRLPREPRFWLIISCVALSLPAFILVRPIASILMLDAISGCDWAKSFGVAAIAVCWRARGSGQRRRGSLPKTK